VGKNTSLKVDGKQEKIRMVDKTFVSQLLLGLVASEVFLNLNVYFFYQYFIFFFRLLGLY
jgi:hypothetical protein